MEEPAKSGKGDGSNVVRGFKKLVSRFSSKSESRTNTSSSSTEANRTKVFGGLQSPSTGTNAVLDTVSHTGNASTGLEGISTSAVDPSITPAPNLIGPSHDTATIASGSGFNIPEAHSPVVPSTPDTTEVTNAAGNAPSAGNPQSTPSGLSAALSTLSSGNTNPAVIAIPSGAAVPASGTVRGSDKPISNADRTPPTPQIAVARTATGPVTTPGIDPASTDGRNTQACLWLRAKDAPIWNQALQTLKEENPEMHKELEETKNSLLESRERKTNEFFKLDTAKPQEKAVVQRCKQYLPSLIAVRGIALTAAALDPHKIAPIVCACVFFSIDLALNNLSPEDKQKMRNILFESVIAINEWISFESNFQKKSHDAIQDKVKELEGLLTGQYLQALRLLCDILLSANGSWTKRAGNKLTNKIVEHEDRLTTLKAHKSMWASKKKLIEETLAGEEDIAKVLKWIQQDGDPEKSLREIGNRVTSGGRYPNCAEWILRGRQFRDWSSHWFPEKTQRPSKRMIWVNGPYGTGKTTIIYRIVSELQALSENYLRREQSEAPADEGQPHRPLQVIPYFCTARSGESKRADDETLSSDESEGAGYYSIIIRALAQKISLMPDFTLAQPAKKFYGTHTRGIQKPIDIELWKEFLRDLLKDDGEASDFVFVIDALDECDPVEDPVNSEKLLDFMRELMQKFPNIQILCSSRQHVPVKEYFSDEVLYPVDALSAPDDEIKNFIRSEIDNRRNKQQGSVFFEAGREDLRKRLKQSLIKHAEGMYEWVNIWLKLTIPIHNTRDTIRKPEGAEEMLKAIEESSGGTNDAYNKLKAGYLRLWKLGALKGFDELRICLFRLILCSFSPLSFDDLTCILQNQMGSLSVRETEILCSNFLVRNVVTQDIVFTHNSAREFVMTEILGKISGRGQKPLAFLTMKECHRSVAKLFMDYMQRSNHQYRSDVSGAFNRFYFGPFGFRHCIYAAEKQSIFDKVWSDMIQGVLLPLNLGSFDVISAVHTYCNLDDDRNLRNTRLFIYRESEGKSHFLFSHFLVWLDIIHDDDVSRLRRMDLRTAPSDTGTPEGMLRHFTEHVVTQSTRGEANALHLACLRRNAAAVKLVLESTYDLFGKEACTDLLSSQSRGFRSNGTPFVLSVTDNLGSHEGDTIAVMETLLWFESRYLDTAGDKEKAHSGQESHRAQQWSHVCPGNENALTYAIHIFEEETVCRLLKIAGPIAIDKPDKSGHTPLMAAAEVRRLDITRILVEDYHADLNVRCWEGSALDIARERSQQAVYFSDIARNRNQQVADYLEKRMSISEPRESVDLSSEVDEDSS